MIFFVWVCYFFLSVFFSRIIHLTIAKFPLHIYIFSYSRCIGFCDRNVKTHLILRGSQIMSTILQKLHTIPADVLTNDSEDLYDKSQKNSIFHQFPSLNCYRIWPLDNFQAQKFQFLEFLTTALELF